MITREELDGVRKMAADYESPPMPRTGHQTIVLYGRLLDMMMSNLQGIFDAAGAGVLQPDVGSIVSQIATPKQRADAHAMTDAMKPQTIKPEQIHRSGYKLSDVRCRWCVYYHPDFSNLQGMTLATGQGMCWRYPAYVQRGAAEHCGEFDPTVDFKPA